MKHADPCANCRHSIACALAQQDSTDCLRTSENRVSRTLLLAWVVLAVFCAGILSAAIL